MSPFMDQITASYRHLYATRYTQVSSLALIVYDYFLTLPDESQLFWNGRWTYPRALFFLNRYQTIFWQIFNTAAGFAPRNTQKFCQAWGHHIVEGSGTSIVFCVHLILAFRIYGLYNRARWITVFLAVLLLATLAGEIYVAIKLAPNFTRIPLPFMINQFVCLPSESTDTSLFFVPVVVFDIIALILVVVRGLSHLQTQRVVGFRGSSLIRIMMRDSLLHFLIILVVYITEAVTWMELPVAERFLLSGYAVSAISMTATRMLINLKREAQRGPGPKPSSFSAGASASASNRIELPVIVQTVIDIK